MTAVALTSWDASPYSKMMWRLGSGRLVRDGMEGCLAAYETGRVGE